MLGIKSLCGNSNVPISKLLGEKKIDDFVSNSIKVRKLTTDEIFWRYHDAYNQFGLSGLWLVDCEYPIEKCLRNYLAIEDDWNVTLSCVSRILIKSGSFIIEGIAKPRGQYVGGHYQALVDVSCTQLEILDTKMAFRTYTLGDDDVVLNYPSQRAKDIIKSVFFMYTNLPGKILQAVDMYNKYLSDDRHMTFLLGHGYFGLHEYEKSQPYLNQCRNIVEDYATRNLFRANEMLVMLNR